MELKKIVIVFKTHFDIGFTKLAREVLTDYSRSLLPKVIDTCRRARAYNPDLPYVWTMSAWPLQQILTSPETAPEDLQTAEELIRSGELTWHMLPYTTHTEFTGIEDYVRGMQVGEALNQKYGKHIHSAKMTDVPGHTRELPSILAKAGVKFLHLGCNAGCTPPRVPRLFWWQGPDGGRVLTFYNKGGYGSSLLPPPEWKLPVWLALIQTNDNMGPHDPEVVGQLVDQARQAYPEAEVVIGTMDEFYDSLEPELTDEIPVITGDLADSWIHGVGSYPEESGLIRSLRGTVKQSEALAVLQQQDTDSCQKIYENILLFGEHTWGLDVKTTLGYGRWYDKKSFLKHLPDEPFRRIEASWEEQKDRAREAAADTAQLERKALEELARRIDCRGEHVTLFHLGAGAADQWIPVSGIPEGPVQVTDAATGRSLPAERRSDGRLWVRTDVPALGYQTLTLQRENTAPSAAFRYDPDRLTLTTPWLTLRLDPDTGAVSSLRENGTDREWVLPGSSGLFLYQYDRFGADDITEFIRAYAYRFYNWLVNDLGRLSYPEVGHGTWRPELKQVSFRCFAHSAQLKIRSANPDCTVRELGNSPEVITTLTVYADRRDIDLTVELPDKQATPYVESGHVLFPVNLKGTRILVDKMGQTVDIARDIVPDANHCLYCADRFIRVEGEGAALTLSCRQAPLWSVGKNDVYCYRHTYEQTEPVLYSNLFNNSWGTNFPQWMSGSYRYDYHLSFDENSVGEAYQSSEAFAAPPLTVYSAADQAGSWPSAHSWITGAEHLEVLTLKRQDEGQGWILRIKSCLDEPAELELTFAEPVETITGCDVLEHPQEKLAENCRSIRLHCNAHEIHTLLLSQDFAQL